MDRLGARSVFFKHFLYPNGSRSPNIPLRRVMKYLRTILAWLVALISTPLTAFAAMVVSSVDRAGRLWWPISQFWAWSITRVLSTRIHVSGWENISAENGAILMSNHVSHLDPPVLIYASDIPTRFLAKKALFYIPFFGWSLWAMGHIAINRRKRGEAFESLKRVSDVIKSGRLVTIFPEGTRGDSDTLQAFKKGGFVIAIQGGIPIIPVGVAGTRAIMPKGWRWFGRGPIEVVFGKAIQTSEYTHDDREALMDRVREGINTSLADARARIED
jgi:1-acyl-sn-glycerol-3-phosphate acyltransferase